MFSFNVDGVVVFDVVDGVVAFGVDCVSWLFFCVWMQFCATLSGTGRLHDLPYGAYSCCHHRAYVEFQH
jgi:hypothetical protein